MTYKLLTTEKSDHQHLKVFYDIVVEGWQIIVDGHEDRINTTHFLSFCDIKNEVVGVASIKNLHSGYKKDTFRKTNVEGLANKYTFEIGYAVTRKAHRRKGISEQLIKALMDNSSSTSFYATTKNDGMRKLMEKVGFSKRGDNCKNYKNVTLSLYHYDEKKISQRH